MATRPAEPTALGKFFAYPAGATGNVAPYWLASSPGSGHRVRMTSACKRAFLATIEAVIERAMAPASCGSYPAATTNFVNLALDAQGLHALVGLGKWTAVADRAGLGARLVRGCPREDWEQLVECVAALWAPTGAGLDAGTVYAWQEAELDQSTSGFVPDEDIYMDFKDALMDLRSWFADAAAIAGNLPEIRPWGDFSGGARAHSVTDWLTQALVSLGSSGFPEVEQSVEFAGTQLDGTPAPLVRDHEGNWFDSSPGAMVNQNITARRSSSAWAVLQAMLANMRFTHLLFPCAMSFEVTTTERVIERVVTMDADGNIAVEIVSDQTAETTEGGGMNAYVDATQDLQVGLAVRNVKFTCAQTDQDGLAVGVRPQGGWSKLGSALVPYLTFGAITPGGGTVTLTRRAVTGVESVQAGTEPLYPAAAFRSYVGDYGGVTFVDSMAYHQGSGTPTWTRYSVRQEAGNVDLRVPVGSHAAWLVDQLPEIPMPTIDPPSASAIATANARFWANWEVYYPSTPNITSGGQPAYFPVAFRNDTFVEGTDIEITFNSTTNMWESDGTKQCIFGTYHLAFPNIDSVQFGPQFYNIINSGDAMAAYQWSFKAMSAA